MKKIGFVQAILLIIILLYPYSYAAQKSKDIYGDVWGVKLFCENQKWGMCDSKDVICVNPAYDLIIPYRNRKAFLTYSKGKKGIIFFNNDSLIVVPAIYDNVQESVWDDSWNIQNDGLYGLVNHVGEEIIAPISEAPIHLQYNNKYILKKKGLFYLADTNGVVYNKTGWEYAGSFYNDRAVVSQNGKWGYIDPNGYIQIDLMWEEALEFANGIAWVKDSGDKYFAINPAGNVLFHTDYSPASNFTNRGTAIIFDTVTEKYGLIDSSGNVVSDGCPWETEYAEFDTNGHWAVTLDGDHWGLVDEMGEIVLPFICAAEYRFMCQFIHGYAVINIDGQETDSLFQVYDTASKHVCSFRSADSTIVDHFENGLMLISINESERAFIDPSGEISIGPREGLVSNFHDERAIIYSNGKYGYINLQGQTVIPPIYDAASDFINGLAEVCFMSKKYYINQDGMIVSCIQQ